MDTHRARIVAWLAGAVLLLGVGQGWAAAPGEAVMAWHVTIAPTWFDPSTAPPQITPFGMLYAIHDALVRPLPGAKMDYALQVEPPAYDPKTARQLLAEAGYPNGLDAGDLVPIPPFFTTAEAVVNDLKAVGVRTRMRPMERAAFYAAWREKKLRGLFITGVGNSGNAASRVQEFIFSQGSYAYGGYPDIDDLFQQQARERDPRKREALLFRIQQLTIDRAMFAPIMDFRALMGVGPRVTEHTITWIHNSPFPSYEDMRLKD